MLRQYKSVLITGGTGFLGQALVKSLQKKGVSHLHVLSSADADLRNRDCAHRIIAKYKPECVIHAAVQGGGIGWMKEHPVESGLDNVRMNLNMLEASFQGGVVSFVGVSSACVYPKNGSIPYREDSVWDGYPEPTNGSYALSKRIMMDMGRAYAQQHNFHSVFPVLANLYGPGDHLDPRRAHVVADLMIRCSQNPSTLRVWGTGAAKREFLFVDDAAEGVLACLNAPNGSIVNIGSGIETPIISLAKAIVTAYELNIEIELDPTKPDGQLRKVLDVQKAQKILAWRPNTSLKEGLRKTALWYKSQLSTFPP